MKYFATAFAFFAIVLFALPDFADAARMGGGRSFGGKPSYSTPSPSTGGGAGMNTGINRQTTPSAGAAAGAGAATASRGSMGMGLMGGLLAGSLIGSMFMGGGMAGAGGGGGFLDILILGLLAYLGYRFYTSYKRNKESQNNNNYTRNTDYTNTQKQSGMWDNLSTKQNSSSDFAQGQGSGASLHTEYGFDSEEFLQGAKTAYIRMQESWDKRDLQDIALFATSAVLNELKAQAAADPTPSNTEILTLQARIKDADKEGTVDNVAVYFEALMRENKEQVTPTTVQEVWHFTRESENAQWKLNGIQQVS